MGLADEADEDEEAVEMMEEEVTTEEADAGCEVDVELERPTRFSSHVHLPSTCSAATTSSKHVTPAQRMNELA